MNLLSTAASIYLTCFPVFQDCSRPVTVEHVLKAHGLPLFTAQSARVEAVRPKAATGSCVARMSRLVTKDFRVIYTEEEARQLTDTVLLYCTEPEPRRGWGDLALAAHAVGAQMSRASPLLGPEVPLPLARPFRITLAFVDRRGRVLRTETHTIIELAHDSGPIKRSDGR
jgi:hypothetical protein